MAQIRLIANDPLLAHQLEGWAKDRRSDGHDVEVLQELRESRDVGDSLAVASLALQIADMTGAVDWAKRELRAWFTEPKKQAAKRVHVVVVDKTTGKREEFDLP